MAYRYLSYPLDDRIPVYGGEISIGLEKLKSIANNDASNTYSSQLSSHWGTHMDAPNHFFELGEKISQLPASGCFFRAPLVLDIALDPSALFNDLSLLKAVSKNTDLLLFRSGWSARRGQKEYWLENPGIHSDAAFYLRREFPCLRAVGMDWISVSSFSHRAEGREAHRAFLDPLGEGKPIYLIEDMDLSADCRTLKAVFVMPLRVRGFDSAPCTVVGEFSD